MTTTPDSQPRRRRPTASGPHSIPLAAARARAIWLRAQRLHVAEPFGAGPGATLEAVQHLGYVQIDTINVIERCHHHILFTRLPGYRRRDLAQLQSVDKSVFEYWTHALAYVPTSDFRYFIPAMKRYREAPQTWFGTVEASDYHRLLRRIGRDGALSIRDIDDDVLVDKHHPWASRKPSKRGLQHGFFVGDLTISARAGMVKTYELTDRHFGWPQRPRQATEGQYARYLLDRALRTQGIVSLESACRGEARCKPAVAALIDLAVRRRQLVPVHLEGAERAPHWAEPATLEPPAGAEAAQLVHILSPFDPLIIQRQRFARFFGYAHRFEAYVPAPRRVLGYFALPVLAGDRIVAAIDLKADRQRRHLRIQNWSWLVDATPALQTAVDEALHRFEAFQFPVDEDPAAEA